MIDMLTIEEARIHGLLCAEGYLEKSRPRSRPRPSHREKNTVGWNYRVRLSNKNLTLLNNFKELCEKVFKVRVFIRNSEYEARIYSKEVYEKLSQIGSIGSHIWIMPVEKMDKNATCAWIQGFFDGEASVYSKDSKSIKVSSVNEKGLLQINKALKNLGIENKLNGPYLKKESQSYIFVLSIYGKENLKRYKELINFIHLEKREKLEKALTSYKR